MEDFSLLRSVMLTVDDRWRPIDAYVRLAVGDEYWGAAWYRFEGCRAQCHGYASNSGPFSDVQTTEEPIQSFGSHALHNDAWLLARVRSCGGDFDSLANATFTTSLTPNGGTGPELVRVPPTRLRISDLGTETVTVPAGRFEAQHVQVEVNDVDRFNLWAAGADCVPVRLDSERLHQTFELIELAGDVR